MSLSEFWSLVLHTSEELPCPMAYVVSSERAFDALCDGGDPKDIDILFTLCSNFRLRVYLKDEFLAALVLNIGAIDKDKFVVWVEVSEDLTWR